MFNANEFSFGVEIETYVNRDALAARGWMVGPYHVGYRLAGNFNGWTIQRDGSLGEVPSAAHVGAEFVSPVLRGVEGLANLKAMLDVLNNELDARVNKSCGLHVHVFWSDANSNEDLQHLISSVAHHEMGLYAACGTTARMGNTFCSSVRTSDAARQMADGAAEVRSTYVNRYSVLNLSHVRARRLGDASAKPTVEFRVFAGSTSFIKIAAYVQIAVGLVAKATAKRTRKPSWEQTSVHRLAQRKGEGVTAIEALMWYLNWTRYGRKVPVRYGVMVGPDTQAAVQKELRRLAKKFDRARTPQAVRVRTGRNVA